VTETATPSPSSGATTTPLHRLFVALDLPESIKLRLSALRTGDLAARWVEAEKLHLTLRFIGEVEEPAALAIDAALRQVEAPGFSLALARVGHFGRHTLWAGVPDCPPLLSLQAKIEAAIRQAGLPGEPRRYVPHVKLASLRWRGGGALRRFLREHADFRTDAFDIGRFSLIESFLGKSGSSYRHRADHALQPVQQEAAPATASAP